MSGIIAGGLAQSAANTAYLAKGDEIFQRPPVGAWALFSDVVPCEGQFLELDTIGPSPIVRELVGSRRFGALRAYAKRTRVTPYSTDALELSRLQIPYQITSGVRFFEQVHIRDLVALLDRAGLVAVANGGTGQTIDWNAAAAVAASLIRTP